MENNHLCVHSPFGLIRTAQPPSVVEIHSINESLFCPSGAHLYLSG